MIEVYKDAAKKFRWRIKARNGRILADSGQGYSRRGDCVAGMLLAIAEGMPPRDVRYVTAPRPAR